MDITKQHEYYEKRLEELLKEMPFFVVKYVDDKLDIRSPLTLFNYVRDFKEFFQWLISKNIVVCPSIKQFPVESLESLYLDDANNYFKYISSLQKIKRSKEPQLPIQRSSQRSNFMKK